MSSPMQRRVGLSRNQPASPLLKSLSRSRASREPLSPATKTSAAAPAPAVSKMAPKFKVPVSFDAPPLSTDDENESSEGEAARENARKHSQDPMVDSSEDQRPARGDIKRTSFQSSNKTNGRPGPGAKGQEKKSTSSTEPQPTRSRKKRKLSAGSDNDEGRPSSLTPGPADHFKDKHGFTKMISSKIKYKAREKQKAYVDDDIDDKNGVDDENDHDHDYNKRRASKIKTTFKDIPIHDSPKRAAKFIHPGDALSSSPEKKFKRLKLNHLDAAAANSSDDEDSTLTKGRTVKRPGPNKLTPRGKAGLFIPRKKGAAGIAAAGKKSTGREPRSSPSLPSLPSSPVKKLVIPTPFSQFEAPKDDLTTNGGDDDDSDFLSDVPSDISTPSLLELITASSQTAVAATTSCPWCGASVKKTSLQDFAKGKRLNVRMQSKFCQSHKKETALETWKQRKYPEVQWDELEDRFSEHRELLLGIINGQNSHYRSILATRIELGQVRSMKKEENLNPGYYGPRGFNAMCDYLVGEFGDLLKEKAVADKVIAGRGSAAFIQLVLVPELAVHLIKEDMRVSVREAREIMEESKSLGELIHEDV